MLISIFWISQVCTLCMVLALQDSFFRHVFLVKDSSPIKGNCCFFHFPVVLHYFFLAHLHRSLMTTHRMLNKGRREHKKMTSTLATHASTRAVNESMCRKPRLRQNKEAETPNSSWCSCCLLWIWPYSGQGEDKLLFTRQCLAWNMILVGGLSSLIILYPSRTDWWEIHQSVLSGGHQVDN